MDPQESKTSDLIIKFVQKNVISLSLGFLGLIFLSIGLIQFLGSKNEITYKSGEESAKDVESAKDSVKIVVDVSGAVMSPGVYELNPDSRIKDILVSAGGLSDDADRDFVSKRINLAQKLSDGIKIYIPFKSEMVGSSKAVAGVLGVDDTLININSASMSQLDTLAGIGKVTAEKIIVGRPYGKIEELTEKKIVSSSVFEKIKEKITVY